MSCSAFHRAGFHGTLSFGKKIQQNFRFPLVISRELTRKPAGLKRQSAYQAVRWFSQPATSPSQPSRRVDTFPESFRLYVLSFYCFVKIVRPEYLDAGIDNMLSHSSVRGTVILSHEGVNACLCGLRADLDDLMESLRAEDAGFDACVAQDYVEMPYPAFSDRVLKIKPEIVTFGSEVDVLKARGQHVDAGQWDRLLADPEVIVLDARKNYEVAAGTFRRALNPSTATLGELKAYMATLDTSKPLAMFCTGGIRCEKLSAYALTLGFRDVYQLKGGILTYMAQRGQVQDEAGPSAWQGGRSLASSQATTPWQPHTK